MQTSRPFWKLANWTILFLQTLILTIGLFLRHIAFGWGLGDIFWYILIIIALVTHLILTLIFKNKLNRLRTLTVIFSIFTVFICLRATIWRGSEYSWNGDIFYPASDKTSFRTIPIDSLEKLN